MPRYTCCSGPVCQGRGRCFQPEVPPRGVPESMSGTTWGPCVAEIVNGLKGFTSRMLREGVCLPPPPAFRLCGAGVTTPVRLDRSVKLMVRKIHRRAERQVDALGLTWRL